MMERPAELLDLLNPICCALFLRNAIDGYARESQSGLPYALSMLVLPFVLHKRTRDALPARLTTTLAVWTQRNPELLMELPRRLHTLDAYYREAMIWGLARNIYELEVDALRATHRTPFTARSFVRTHEVAACERCSILVGRWFAHAGNASTVLTLLGVTI